ncbi:MAG: S8 family serine peptidase [Hydrogenibacillus sp.]|nr:S8 family serine peptidase [Hydrogenibacillus sp.]
MVSRRLKRWSGILLTALLILNLWPAGVWADNPPHKDDALSELRQTAKTLLQAQRQQVLAEQANRTAVARANASESLRDEHAPDEWVRVIVTLRGDDVLSRLRSSSTTTRPLATQPSVQNATDQLLKAQNLLLQKLQNSGIEMRLRHQFVTLINAFSADIRYKDIPKLKALDGVIDVQPAQVFYPDRVSKTLDSMKMPADAPDMYFSAPLIGAQAAWELGYRGDDVIVAIVDSGINYFHPAFGGEGHETLKLGGHEDLTLKDGYNARVIGGYNWADNNNDIVDRTDSQHGVHVAGTVGGYDDRATGVINGQPFSGVAPHVKFLAEKVFSNDPDRASTTSDEYIAAVEHAVTHGAKVINMSLGSPAGAFNPEDPFYQVMKKASDQGVVFSISAGNNDRSTGALYPFAENPDVALVGSPSINPPSISVAASMNEAQHFDAMAIDPAVDKGGQSIDKIPMLPASANPHPSSVKGSHQLVLSGLGRDLNDFPKEVKGNVALIQRGVVPFETKVKNAIQAGAVAAIIYNNVDSPEFVSMATGSATGIPAAFIRGGDGSAIAEAIKKGQTISVRFDAGDKVKVELAVDTMTSFSSWGYEPALGFKPTLTAPGGSIVSSIGADQYASFNGTSMAAPHVAGAAALVIERLTKNGIAYDPATVRAILANTSKILKDPGTGTPYPIRRQGAGRIQVDKAVQTDVVAMIGEEPAANLGSLTERTKRFTVTLKNFGSVERHFTLKGDLYTDAVVERPITYAGSSKAIDLLQLTPMDGLALTSDPQQITVPAKGSVTVDVAVTIPETLPQDRFVEGWLTFVAEEGSGQPDLVFPVYGFYGDWGRPSVIDAHWTSPDSYVRYYFWSQYKIDLGGTTGLYDEALDPLGLYLDAEEGWAYNPDYAAISTAKEQASARRTAIPLYTFLRNAKSVIVRLTDAEGRALRTLDQWEDVRKNDLKSNLIKIFGPWDGTIHGKPAPDGQYIIETLAVPYSQEGKAQSLAFPVKVVSRIPEVRIDRPDDATYRVQAETPIGIEAVYAVAYDHNAGWSEVALIPAIADEANAHQFTAHVDVSQFAFEEAEKAPVDFNHADVFFMVVDTAGNAVFKDAMNDVPLILDEADLEGNAVHFTWFVQENVSDIRLTVDDYAAISARSFSGDWRKGLILPLPVGDHRIKLEALDQAGNVLAERNLTFDQVTALDPTHFKDIVHSAAPNEDRITLDIPYRILGQGNGRLVVDVYGHPEASQTIDVSEAPEGTVHLTLDVPGTYSVTMATYLDAATTAALTYGEDVVTGQVEFHATVDRSRPAIFDRHDYELAQGQTSLSLRIKYAPDVSALKIAVVDPFTQQRLTEEEATVTADDPNRERPCSIDLGPYAGLPELDLVLLVNGEETDRARVHTGQTGVLQYTSGGYSERVRYTKDSRTTIEWAVTDAVYRPSVIELAQRTFDLGGRLIDEGPVLNEADHDDAGIMHADIDLSNVPDKGQMEIWVTAYDANGLPIGRLLYTVKRSLAAPLVSVVAPGPFEELNAETGRDITYLAYLPRALAEFVDVDSMRLWLETTDGQWVDMTQALVIDPSYYVPEVGYLMLIYAEGLEAKKEGYQNIRLAYQDLAGNETQHNRKIYADLTPPVITLSGVDLRRNEAKSSPVHSWYEAQIQSPTTSYPLNGTVEDNLSSFVLSIDGDLVMPLKNTRMGQVDTRDFTYVVDFPEGAKIVNITAEDGVGNRTTIELTLQKSAPSPAPTPEPPSKPGPIPHPEPVPKPEPTEPPKSESPAPGSQSPRTTPMAVGQLTTTETPEGKVYRLSVSADAVQQAMDAASKAGSHRVTLNLTEISLTTGDQLTVHLDARHVQALIDGGYTLSIHTAFVTIELTPEQLKDTRDAQGNLDVTVLVKKPDEQNARIAALGRITFVSPVIELKTSTDAWTSPVSVVLSVNMGTKDWRKAAVYAEQAAGAWRYLGGKVDRQNHSVRVALERPQAVAAIVYEKTFADIQNHWAKDAVEVAAAHQLVKGRSNDVFAPQANVTRAEFAAMLLNALGVKPQKGALPFRDVNPGAWYADVVATAYALKIAQGYDGTFRPEASITREEMAVMFAQALKLIQGEQAPPTFKDAANIAPWAQAAVGILQKEGYLSGKVDGRFAPKDWTTRAEAAAMLYQWLMKR